MVETFMYDPPRSNTIYNGTFVREVAILGGYMHPINVSLVERALI